MVRQKFIDQILESENLTDELEDSEAKWLLNWGIDQVDQILYGIKDENLAAAKTTALMAVIRKINRIEGWRQQKDSKDLALDLADLRSLFSDAFGLRSKTSANDCLATARQIKSLNSSQEIILLLTRWGRSPTSNI